MSIGYEVGMAIGGAGMSLANGIYGIYSDVRNRDLAARQLEQDTIRDRRDYDMSREIFDYNKWRDQLTMDREDSAITRRVEDLRRAGLHPSLAAGGAAATSQGISSHANKSSSPPGGQTYASAKFDMENMERAARIALMSSEAKVNDARATNIEQGTTESQHRIEFDADKMALWLKQHGLNVTRQEVDQAATEANTKLQRDRFDWQKYIDSEHNKIQKTLMQNSVAAREFAEMIMLENLALERLGLGLRERQLALQERSMDIQEVNNRMRIQQIMQDLDLRGQANVRSWVFGIIDKTLGISGEIRRWTQ